MIRNLTRVFGRIKLCFCRFFGYLGHFWRLGGKFSFEKWIVFLHLVWVWYPSIIRIWDVKDSAYWPRLGY